MDVVALKPAHYHSIQALAIILVSSFVVLFYNADWLIGAIGILPFYSIPGFVLSFAFLIGTLGLACQYQFIPDWLVVISIIIFVVVIYLFNIALIAVGWMAAIVVLAFIPFPAVAVGLVIMFVLWFRTNSSPNVFRVRLIQRLMVVLLLFMAGYVLGIGSKNMEFDRRAYLPYQNRQYVVNVYSGWLGDPDTLAVYECNQWGLFCKRVFRKSGNYLTQTIQLVPNENGQDLMILVAGKPIDRLRPSD